ncbi:histone deacetylase 3 [Pelomyxa schiedti]|nr:histone deacetylase 3 [Pelomyxa schiedti]
MSRICYFYDPLIGNFYYGQRHPMKPYRLSVTHSMILSYGLHNKMQVYRPHHATTQELMQFHTPEFIQYLYGLDAAASNSRAPPVSHFITSGGDCPVFSGMTDFIELYAGASIDAARKLNQGVCDVAINWSGGLHHARRQEASGFCYVNDIVLAIIELLKCHPRVLYIDIDIHHGDGVQEAFYLSDRVMCLSFHKFGNGFFPGTGDIDEIGLGAGKYTTINVPLRNGIDDTNYLGLFKPILSEAVSIYRPTAIVLQCGADSLNMDRLGVFNLTHKGHGDCVSYVQSFNIPLLVLGGGGYTVRNVARAWTYETALLTHTTLQNQIPHNDYIEYFGPDYQLVPNASRCAFGNENTKAYLSMLLRTISNNLRMLKGAPSVQMRQPPPYVITNPDPVLLCTHKEHHRQRLQHGANGCLGFVGHGRTEETHVDRPPDSDHEPDVEENSCDARPTGKNGAENFPVHDAEFYDNDADQDHGSP